MSSTLLCKQHHSLTLTPSPPSHARLLQYTIMRPPLPPWLATFQHTPHPSPPPPSSSSPAPLPLHIPPSLRHHCQPRRLRQLRPSPWQTMPTRKRPFAGVPPQTAGKGQSRAPLGSGALRWHSRRGAKAQRTEAPAGVRSLGSLHLALAAPGGVQTAGRQHRQRWRGATHRCPWPCPHTGCERGGERSGCRRRCARMSCPGAARGKAAMKGGCR